MITIIRLYQICKKYRIPFKDLPMILEEYISYDNDDCERMTERFTEIVSLEKIKDNQTGKTYIGIVDSSFIGLVNGIVEEQEYLVFKSKQQRESIRVLLKENEQLKQECKELRDWINDITIWSY